MEKNLYFENYINNLQKEIFLIAYDSCYDIVHFISYYMKSNVRREMDKKYTNWHFQPSSRIFEEVLSSNNDIFKVEKQTINRAAVEWLGFFYSKWHFITKEASSTIVRFLPPSEGLKRFYVLHQLDENDAIEKCKRHYNLSKNNHRKNENSNSGESRIRYNDTIYYSFLAVRILYKLTKNNIFNELSYFGDIDGYDFIDDLHSLGVKCVSVLKEDDFDIITSYKQQDSILSYYKQKADQSIYFCFLFSSSNNEDILTSMIKELRNVFNSERRQFQYLYFYISGKLFEITPSNELYEYYIPLSKRDRAGILNKMRKYGL